MEASRASVFQDPLDQLHEQVHQEGLPYSDSELDALASEVCRMLGEAKAEIDRYSEAERAEFARLSIRYAALKEPIATRVGRLTQLGQEIARRANFGKKKSRDVGYGCYGVRQVPERVEITDEEKAAAWLRVHGSSDAFRVKTEINKSMAGKTVLAVLHATGELASGFEHKAAHDEPFIRPE